MKTIILILFFYLSFNSVFSQATSGTRITAPVVPNDSSDVYPTHDAFFGRDGFRSVTNITQRNNIPAGFRKEGMLIWCKSDSITYQLIGGINNANWVQYSAGGSGTYHPYGGLSTLNLRSDTLKLRGKIKINDNTVLYLPGPALSNNSIFIGNGGNSLNSSSNKCIGIGNFSLNNNTSGNRNIAIGYKSLYSNISGNFNVAIGDTNLYNNTTGSQNLGIGTGALRDNTTGGFNVGIGGTSLSKNTTGAQNVAIGNSALLNNTLGSFNTSIGVSSLNNGTNSNNNVAIGYRAGRFTTAIQSTNYTIKIGSDAGSLDTTDYRGYIEPSNSQNPLIGMKFDEDKVGVNMLITSAWDSIFNVGGGIHVTGGVKINGTNTAAQYKLNALNTVPASATDTGTTGEVRITADYIYICTSTNTWKRTAINTW